MNKLYTAQEIADKLQIKKTTVYELIKRGELYSSKVGKQLRISEQQLKQYLSVPVPAITCQIRKPFLPVPLTEICRFRNFLQKVPFEEGLSSPLQRTDPLRTVFPGSRTSDQPDVHSPSGIPVLQSFMNSYNSLYSLYFKKAHIACASLDLEHIRSLVPGVQLSLLCLYEYSIGLYVPSGNPLKLSGLMDFARKDIKIANREKGSTPRIYLTSFFSQKKFRQPAYLVTILNWYLIFPLPQLLLRTRQIQLLEKNTQHTSPDFWILFRFRHFLCIWSWKRKPFPSLDSLLFLKLYGLEDFRTILQGQTGYNVTRTGELLSL